MQRRARSGRGIYSKRPADADGAPESEKQHKSMDRIRFDDHCAKKGLACLYSVMIDSPPKARRAPIDKAASSKYN